MPVVKVCKGYLFGLRDGSHDPPPPTRIGMVYDQYRIHMSVQELDRDDLAVLGKDNVVFRRAKWKVDRYKLVGPRLPAEDW